MATTTLGPISTQQINGYYYVGGNAFPTIQAAVNAAVAVNNGVVIIPWDYAGSDTVAGVTGGAGTVTIRDERYPLQGYIWNSGAGSYFPQVFMQLFYGPITTQQITTQQINNYYYVGIAGSTIQGAVDIAVAANNGIVIIPWDYAGSDTVEGVTGGANTVSIRDERYPLQSYAWSGSEYLPANFIQLGLLIANGGEFTTCDVAGSPVRTFDNTPTPVAQVYPGIGIGVSTGSAWGTSIDPATLQGKLTLTTTGNSGPATLAGNILNIPQYSGGAGMVYPPAGIPNSTGSAWGTSIDPATIARTNAANTFTAAQTVQGAITASGDVIAANVHMGGSVSDPTRATLASVGANLLLSPPPGNGTTNINWVGGSGGTIFGNGASTQIGSIDKFGNAAFSGTGIFAGLSARGIGALGPSRVNLSCGADGVSFIDFFGTTPAAKGTANFRIASSDASLVTNVLNIDAIGNAYFYGTLAAGVKSFRIPHPQDKTKDLIHSCLEGPEAGVYYRGEAKLKKGSATVELPEYFEALTFDDDRTVLLTLIVDDEKPVFGGQIAAGRIKDGKFKIYSTDPAATVAWEVKAARRINEGRLQVVRDRIETATGANA